MYTTRHVRKAPGLRNTLRLVTCVGLALSNVAWLDPVRDAIAEGNRLFHAGQFEEALTHYGQVLVDDPDSPLLNFNMGAAHYKAGNYDAALSSLGRVPGEDDAQPRTARTAYNLGNTQYQIGAAAEAVQPQAALEAYTAAQAAYRRALGLDPSDQDAKFNYELVAKKSNSSKSGCRTSHRIHRRGSRRPTGRIAIRPSNNPTGTRVRTAIQPDPNVLRNRPLSGSRAVAASSSGTRRTCRKKKPRR